MLASLLYAAAVPLEVCGLFAFWRWSRGSGEARWLVLGGAILFVLIAILLAVPNPFPGGIYVALFGTYLGSGLLWTWRRGLGPARWNIGEAAVAVLAVLLLAIPMLR